MESILGIDVAKAKFDVCLLLSTGAAHGSFANHRAGFAKLQRWLVRHQVGALHACIEATGRYGHDLAHVLHDQGYTVSVVNPRRIAAYVRSKLLRSKTDRLDAQLIADFCRTQQPDPWRPLSQAEEQRQALARHIEALKRDRQRERNRLQAGVPSRQVQQAIEEHLDFLQRQIERLEQELAAAVEQDEQTRQQMRLLTSINGIGVLTAAKFLAEVPDVTRFAQTAQLDAFAGLVPKIAQSGQSRRRSGLNKTGNPHLRTLFYMPALVAQRYNPTVRALAERLERRGKSKMTIVIAVMRKLLHLCYGVLKTGKSFDPNHCSSPLAT